ncbi:tapasin-related protein-like [Pristis pectinata]|uniref:tapasin-related protein-like n=1 Tax=Pristis pectinata TaxID=685728 RepID=UPI00223C97B7|nr:tapasin-related protein-like [Pristis pectinata]
MMLFRHLYILVIGIALAQNGHTLPNRKLDCTFREEKQDDGTPVLGHTTVTRKALLLFGDIDTDEEAIRFKVKDSSLDIFHYVGTKPDDLECEISRYSTHGFHVPWPHQGAELTENKWFTVTIKNRHGKFTTTSFMRKLKASNLEVNEKSEAPTDDEDSPIGNTDTLLVQVNYIIHTSTPLIRTKLKQDLVLDCGYKIDHSTDVNIDWRYQYKGVKKKLFSYNGRNQQVEHIEKGVGAFLDQIKNGNASLRIRNVDINNEGSYTCLVYVPPLFGTHTINLEIMEPPKVSLNHDSLSLKEGDEQKLACDAEMYYPLDVTMKWQRQQGREHLLPVYLTNTVFSSHKPNKDGTFNVTSYFRFTASLRDDGATFICQVGHISLEKAIKRYVHVNVEARSQILLYILILILSLFFCAVLIILLIHLSKVMDKNKKKPY